MPTAFAELSRIPKATRRNLLRFLLESGGELRPGVFWLVAIAVVAVVIVLLLEIMLILLSLSGVQVLQTLMGSTVLTWLAQNLSL